MRAEDILPEGHNQVRLPDGTLARKGTVAAFLANARVWCDPLAGAAQRRDAERDMCDALPALRALGLFEVLSIRDAALRQWVEAQ
ncbi:MAG: hypothetical protein QM586_15025 [Xenophilus sp.]